MVSVIIPALYAQAAETVVFKHAYIYSLDLFLPILSKNLCSLGNVGDSLRRDILPTGTDVRDRANSKLRVLICDGFGTYETLKNKIILYRLLSHTSYKLQPCNVRVFASLKTAYRNQVERLYRRAVEIIKKSHFKYLYDPARRTAFTSYNGYPFVVAQLN
ncbi:hypothetical protein GGP41_008477 [Bipolaris sorokiniana]|uniref:DDE-1 domain-containing protein n=1 Tax=Cochliobolus sativus TaxID=45130 RepID=A0A8H6DTP4_COCSA|nr:hypothetical protein GGP41_008477 [Bipolaris sorokiniana]